jgi:tetratricopeptide (TPR) repeat protein
MAFLRAAIIPRATRPNVVLGIQRALELLWLLTVVIVPLAFLGREFGTWSSVIGSFELPKIVALRSLVGIMAALWLIEWVVQARSSNAGASSGRVLDPRPGSILGRIRGWLRAKPTRWLALAAAFFLGATLLSTLLSVSPKVSLWGEVPGQDSYSAYTTVAYVLLFAVIATHLKTSSQLWRLLGAIVVVGVLFAGYAVLQHYGHDVFDLMVPVTALRATSTVSNAILAGSVMLITILVSLVGATITLRGPMGTTGFWWNLGLWGLVLAVQLMGLLFTYARGPWVGTVVALVGFIGLLAALGHWRILVRATMVLLLAAAVASAIIFLASRLSQEQAGGKPDPSTATVAAALVASVPAQVIGAGNQLGAPGLSGRVEVWRGAWGLMIRHPWFGFDSLPLAFLRPLVGYGPDFFHAAYLLVSPGGHGRIPSEFVHAHNYFVHQGVELGFLGLAATVGVFGTLLLLGGYQLLWQRKSYSIVHQLLLVGVVATVGGRLLEQMVGIARVSDMTLFWVLLGVFAALPAIMDGREKGPAPPSRPRESRRRPNRARSTDVPSGRPDRWRFLERLALVCCLVVGIGVLTWVKGINYIRAAAIADRAAAQYQAGHLQASLSSIERSIDLAPDVNSYYGNRSDVYEAFEKYGLWSQHLKCGGLAELQVRKACLAKEAYLGNLGWVENRPLSWRSRIGLAGSAVQVATLTKDRNLAEEAIRLHRETAEMVPASYLAWDRLADVYIVLGQPQQALEALEKSLAILGDHRDSYTALLLQAEAYQNLGQIQQELESLGRVITVRPGHPEPYYLRGSVYRLLGQHERAVEDLNQAIHLSGGSDARAYHSRALAFAGLGRDAEAREDLERAVDLGADRTTLTAAIEELKKQR